MGVLLSCFISALKHPLTVFQPLFNIYGHSRTKGVATCLFVFLIIIILTKNKLGKFHNYTGIGFVKMLKTKLAFLSLFYLLLVFKLDFPILNSLLKFTAT